MKKQKVRKAILVVAGVGTRFLPATKSIPKEMMPLIDKPVIQFLVEEIVRSDIREIVFVVSPGKEAIMSHFRHNPSLERFLHNAEKRDLLNHIRHLHRQARFHVAYQPRPLGNAHAVLCAKRFIRNEPFAVLFGDDIVDGDPPALKQMLSIFNAYQEPIIALERVPWAVVSRYGVVGGVKIKNRLYRINEIVEKPSRRKAPSNLTVVGKYILTPGMMKYVEKTKPRPGGETFLTESFRDYVAGGGWVLGYEFRGIRFDCGDKLGYLKAKIHFALKHPQLKKDFRNYLHSLKV